MPRSLLFFYIIGAFSVCTAYSPTDQDLDAMPDFGKPNILRELRCSACHASVIEIFEAMTSLDERKGKKFVKEYDHIEVMEAVCYDPKLASTRITERFKRRDLPVFPLSAWGLQRRNNKPTTMFSRDTTISRVQGNWIGIFLTNMCNEIIGEHDEAILKGYVKDNKSVHELANYVCGKKVLNTCDKALLGTEELFKIENPETYAENAAKPLAGALNGVDL